MRPGSWLRLAIAASTCAGACLLAASAGVPGVAPPVAAQPAATAAPAPADDPVVVRVGGTELRRSYIERRLSETPRAALAKLGSTPDEIKRAFIDQVLLPDVLISEDARARGVDQLGDVRPRLLGLKRAALVQDLRQSSKADAITPDEIKSYYQANAEKFVSPKRLLLNRILVEKESDAKDLIAELGAKPDQKKWNDVARERSLDRSSHLKGGNLGLVAEDGSTAEQDRRVEPALFKAAVATKDGELVPTPVAEAGKWAVVWKRQTNREITKSIESEAPSIRAAIADERLRAAVQTLLGELRASSLKEENADLCDMVAINATGDVERASRPGTLPRAKHGARPAPSGAPGGLR